VLDRTAQELNIRQGLRGSHRPMVRCQVHVDGTPLKLAGERVIP